MYCNVGVAVRAARPKGTHNVEIWCLKGGFSEANRFSEGSSVDRLSGGAV